jgi:hypothetical protein
MNLPRRASSFVRASKIGAGVEVFLATGQRVAFGELFGEVVAEEHGLEKGWVGLEEFEDGFALLFSLRFERPPGKESQVFIDELCACSRFSISGRLPKTGEIITTPQKRQSAHGGQFLGGGEDLGADFGVSFLFGEADEGVRGSACFFA